MNKSSFYLIVFLAGALFTLLMVLLFGRHDIDLLSNTVERNVVTKKELIIVDESGKIISLPAGTGLTHISQYREEGTFLLEIVSTNIENFEKVEKKSVYFQK